MSNLMKKTKKELIEIILRKDDKELELNQIIDSKQAVISNLEEELNANSDAKHSIELENKNKELANKIAELNKDITQKNKELHKCENTINELNRINDNYVAQLNDSDEAIDNCKQVINSTKKHLKRLNVYNNILLIVNVMLIIALLIAIFVK